jgi:hypothetical protein
VCHVILKYIKLLLVYVKKATLLALSIMLDVKVVMCFARDIFFYQKLLKIRIFFLKKRVMWFRLTPFLFIGLFLCFFFFFFFFFFLMVKVIWLL